MNPYEGKTLEDLAQTMSSEEYLRPTAQHPDPSKTGPCELKLSFACTGAGYERLDPRDMLTPETSFRTPKTICLPCYEMAADHYIQELHS